MSAEWDQKTKAEKLIHLQGLRADVVRQMRREAHTSRSGGSGFLAKLDKQIAELKAQG